MRVQRIIHPVGQGAFYSERFFDDNNKVIANVVYDCGSETTKSKIAINQLPRDQIDYFFLSHFHNDHFNGNEKFFNNRLKINTLVLPQLSIEEAIYCLLTCNPTCKKSTQRLCTLLSNPHCIAHTIILVAPTNKELDTDFLSHTQVERIIHKSYKEMPIFRNIWQYIPIYENTIDPIQVANKISNLMESPLFRDCNSTLQIFKKLIYLLLNQYNIVKHLLTPKDQNEFSMMLLSVPCNLENFTPIEPNLNNIQCTKGYLCQGTQKPISDLEISKPGAFYTGDIPMGIVKNTITKTIKTYNSVLGTYQIPHHGSALNFHLNLFPATEIHFLSAGTRNRYKHPTAILNSLHKLFIVTEEVSSKLSIDLKIK